MKRVSGKNRQRARKQGNDRVSKIDYYLNIAEKVAERSTCLRRKFGAVIVNNDQIISTGYNGAPRKTRNCIDVGLCYREVLGVGRGEKYELCRSVHAEQNAVIHAARFAMLDGTLYVVGLDPATGEPLEDAACCRMCKRVVINAGIGRVIIRTGPKGHSEHDVSDWIKNNLGELEKKGSRLVPKKVMGY